MLEVTNCEAVYRGTVTPTNKFPSVAQSDQEFLDVVYDVFSGSISADDYPILFEGWSKAAPRIHLEIGQRIRTKHSQIVGKFCTAGLSLHSVGGGSKELVSAIFARGVATMNQLQLHIRSLEAGIATQKRRIEEQDKLIQEADQAKTDLQTRLISDIIEILNEKKAYYARLEKKAIQESSLRKVEEENLSDTDTDQGAQSSEEEEEVPAPPPPRKTQRGQTRKRKAIEEPESPPASTQKPATASSSLKSSIYSQAEPFGTSQVSVNAADLLSQLEQEDLDWKNSQRLQGLQSQQKGSAASEHSSSQQWKDGSPSKKTKDSGSNRLEDLSLSRPKEAHTLEDVLMADTQEDVLPLSSQSSGRVRDLDGGDILGTSGTRAGHGTLSRAPTLSSPRRPGDQANGQEPTVVQLSPKAGPTPRTSSPDNKHTRSQSRSRDAESPLSVGTMVVNTLALSSLPDSSESSGHAEGAKAPTGIAKPKSPVSTRKSQPSSVANQRRARADTSESEDDILDSIL